MRVSRKFVRFTVKIHRHSALMQQQKETEHRIDYSNIKILIDMVDLDRELLLKEMLHIDNYKPELDTQKNQLCLETFGNKESSKSYQSIT